jgi:hypothetical protein
MSLAVSTPTTEKTDKTQKEASRGH